MLLKLIEILFYYLLFKFYILSESSYENKIINFIQNNGIVFIKFGQIISSRNDINNYFSKSLQNKFRNLQDKCFYDYKYNYYKNINYLDYNPIAAGSIASIFLIFYNNKKCVLKQLNPNIETNLKKSVINLETFINYLRFFTKINFLNILDYNEYHNYLIRQTDFNIEAKTQKFFYSIFEDYDNIIIPKVEKFNENTIIMEYVEGLKFNDFVKLYPDYENECLGLIIAAMMVMVNNNVIHGDLHYGNFLFINQNNNIKIIILDFGITSNLTEIQSNCLKKILNPKTKDFTRDFEIFIQSFDNKFIIKSENGQNFNQLINILEHENIKLPSDIISFFTTLQTLKLNVYNLRKKYNNLNEYLSGFLLENDYL